jgi:c-di-GMP-binding flagellar brake protein YcgR
MVVRGNPGEEHEHDILDLSATGVAFRLREDQPTIREGQVIEHARMELGPQVPIPVSMVVRSVLKMNGGAPGHDTYRVGAEFANLPGPVERRIQVYVLDTERATRRMRDME